MFKSILTKVLGISLLAIVGVLAVNASAAHATWTLLKGGTSVSLLALNANLLEGELLVEELGLEINCPGGTATANVNSANSVGGAHVVGGSILEGEAHALFTGCFVLGFEEVCEVFSPGLNDGEILAEGAGTGTRSGENTIALVEDTEFTTISLAGVFCPFDGISEPVSGSAVLTLLTSSASTKDHLAHLDDEELFYGTEKALIDGPGGTDTALAHVTEATGATWAIDFK